MKKLQFLLLMTLIFTACQKKNNVTITGKVTNNSTNEVLYSAFVNEPCDYRFFDTISTDTSGTFSIKLKVTAPSFLSIKTKSCYKRIIVEPNSKYEIEINEESEQINFISEKSEIQNFYDDLPDSHPMAFYFTNEDFTDIINTYRGLKVKLDADLQKLTEINCSEATRELLKADREVYYNIIISSLVAIKHRELSNNNEIIPERYMNLWGKAVSDSFLLEPITKKSYFYFDLLGQALWYNIYTKMNYDTIKDIRKGKRVQGLIKTHDIELAQKLLPKEIIEYYTATYIQSETIQHKFQKELINLYEQFKSDYPKSKYTSNIKPNIDEIANFHRIVEQDFNSQIKILEDPENMKSLKDCIKPFHGKKVYVDIWATWCGWCKKEFEFNNDLQNVLKQYNTEMLYISTDRDKDEKLWKDMIKYYNLAGNHIRVSGELKSNIKSELGMNGIPRYVIINEKGEVIDSDAPRPSDMERLKEILSNI